MEYKDTCKGCYTYIEIENAITRGKVCRPNKGDIDCPCLKCIIKMMCRNPCLQFDSYRTIDYVRIQSY